MPNPLSNIDGEALRQQSLWLLKQADSAHVAQSAYEPVIDGLVNLLDEIRSYCHDEHGIDCLLQEDEPNGTACPTCGNPAGCGSDPPDSR